METFIPFGKIPRWSRDIVITEKIDGTNGTICIEALPEEGRYTLAVASRTRWITSSDDNYGFAKWAEINTEELLKLGPGWHRGEWWGKGIQRGYGLAEKKFSLFNVAKWHDPSVRPACCGVVPVLYTGPLETDIIRNWLEFLNICGSQAAPGWMRPEGIVIWHSASGHLYKKTLEKDEGPKGVKE